MKGVSIDKIIEWAKSRRAKLATPKADSSIVALSGDELLVLGKSYPFSFAEVRISYYIVEGEGGIVRESEYRAPPAWNTIYYTHRLVPKSDPFVVEARLEIVRQHDVAFTLGGTFYVYVDKTWYFVRAGDLDP